MAYCDVNGRAKAVHNIFMKLQNAIPEGEYRLDLRYSSEAENIHGLLLSSRSFTVAVDTPPGLEGIECLRHAEGLAGTPDDKCRGCTVLGVTDLKIVKSECEPAISGDPGRVVEDGLLADDVARQRAYAAAGMHPDGVGILTLFCQDVEGLGSRV